MKKNLVLKICLCANMAALAIALDFISIKIGNDIKITLYALPLMFVGIMYGPTLGLLTGLVSGFVMQIISEYGLGPTTPLWMLAPIIWGALSGFIYKLLKSKNTLINIGIVVISTSIFVTLINSLVIFLDSKLMGYASTQTFLMIFIKIGTSLVMSVIYIFLLWVLTSRLTWLSFNEKTVLDDEHY